MSAANTKTQHTQRHTNPNSTLVPTFARINHIRPDGPLAVDTEGKLAGPIPPHLVGIQGFELRILACPELVLTIPHQWTSAAEGEPRTDRVGRHLAPGMRHRELQGRRLGRLDKRKLASRGRGVDGQETQPARGVAADFGAAKDQRLRIGLVLDLAEVCRVIGVGELEGLEFGEVEETLQADAEPEVAVYGLSLGIRGRAGRRRGGCGCEKSQGSGGSGVEMHFCKGLPF